MSCGPVVLGFTLAADSEDSRLRGGDGSGLEGLVSIGGKRDSSSLISSSGFALMSTEGLLLLERDLDIVVGV